MVRQLPARESGLVPDRVTEPIYIAKGNKVKCAWCGDKFKTRAKYVSHFERRHLNG